MPAVAQRSVEDYLALDADAPEGVRYEFWKGEVFKMAGAEPEHNQLKDNIARELGNRLIERGCRVMTSDQRVQVGAERYVYPDVVVSCAPEYANTRPRTLLNPELIVEVTSESTVAADRSAKLAAYTEVDSVQEYWIAEPDRLFLTQYVRTEEDEWRLYIVEDPEEAVYSPHFDVEVPLRTFYALVLDE